MFAPSMGADDLTMLLAIIQSFRQVQFSLVQSDTATKAAPAIFTRPSGLVELCTRERKYDVTKYQRPVPCRSQRKLECEFWLFEALQRIIQLGCTDTTRY